MQKTTLRGVRFQIDEKGFVQSNLGDLGHIEDCEALAKLLQALFEITDQISLTKPI